MKREILFRGKIKYNGNHLFAGDWAIGSLVLKSNAVFIYVVEEYVVEEDEFGNITREYEVEVIPETIGQFTGLTDKNRVKIFEGDIVRADWGYLGVVYFEDFIFAKGECRISEDIEVIGNIYDNHELYENGKV